MRGLVPFRFVYVFPVELGGASRAIVPKKLKHANLLFFVRLADDLKKSIIDDFEHKFLLEAVLERNLVRKESGSDVQRIRDTLMEQVIYLCSRKIYIKILHNYCVILITILLRYQRLSLCF